MKKVITYKNIIWDWNGTLLNDLDLCLGIAQNMVTNHRNTRLTLAEYKNSFGFPITSYYEKIGIDLKKESFEVLTDKFVSHYNIGVRKCDLHKNVFDILKQFKQQQKDQYILTAAHLDVVQPILDRFDINHYFKAVEGVNNFRAEGKVARGVQLMQNHQIEKKKTVLIGDTYHDFEVASSMDIDCILVANGHQSKERLIDFTEGKILVINTLNELFS